MASPLNSRCCKWSLKVTGRVLLCCCCCREDVSSEAAMSLVFKWAGIKVCLDKGKTFVQFIQWSNWKGWKSKGEKENKWGGNKAKSDGRGKGQSGVTKSPK